MDYDSACFSPSSPYNTCIIDVVQCVQFVNVDSAVCVSWSVLTVLYMILCVRIDSAVYVSDATSVVHVCDSS